jgi:hypothetical protein
MTRHCTFRYTDTQIGGGGDSVFVVAEDHPKCLFLSVNRSS